MKISLLACTILTISIIGFIQFNPAFSTFEPNIEYLVQGNGFVATEETISNSNLNVLFETGTNSGSRTDLKISSGDITLDDKEFEISNLSGLLLRDGKFMRLSGIIEDFNEKQATMSLFGRIIASNDVASVYEMKGKLRQDEIQQTVHYVIKTGIKMNEPIESESEINTNVSIIPEPIEPNTSETKINLLLSHSERVKIEDTFVFEVKTYDLEQNPRGDYNQNWGHLQDVEIKAEIHHAQDGLIQSFEDKTNNKGVYGDRFVIPENLRTGEYTLKITATLGTSVESMEKIFFILEESDDGAST